jgi:hypothetical protein
VQHRRWSFGDGGARAKVVTEDERERERESETENCKWRHIFETGFFFFF